MFANTKTTVQQGTVGLASAIFYYQQAGYNVCLPLVDNSDYDLITEREGVFYTVQVKTTKAKRSSGAYTIHLRKVRPNRTCNKISPLGKCDLVFVLCDNGDMYSIPYNKIPNPLGDIRTSSVTEYKVSYGSDPKLARTPA